MMALRTKRQAVESARAVICLADIQASILALNDEDLLDLADIFGGEADTALGEMATTEMATRNLSL